MILNKKEGINSLNTGYLTAQTTDDSNENYTPYYAVTPLLKYIDKSKSIWCPFDEEWSAYYQTFKNHGYKAIRSHLSDNQDFFTYEPEQYDVIISNPPYNIKDKILKRLNDLHKPFAMLLPLPSLQGKDRFDWCFKDGIQLLAFDERIGFHHMNKMDKPKEGSPFSAIYFCRDILPNMSSLWSIYGKLGRK